jgi:hypothetical protein
MHEAGKAYVQHLISLHQQRRLPLRFHFSCCSVDKISLLALSRSACLALARGAAEWRAALRFETLALRQSVGLKQYYGICTSKKQLSSCLGCSFRSWALAVT